MNVKTSYSVSLDGKTFETLRKMRVVLERDGNRYSLADVVRSLIRQQGEELLQAGA